MAQPDSDQLEDRARQHLAAAVAHHMNATGLGDAMAGQAAPSTAELKTQLAQAAPQATRHLSDGEVAAMSATDKLVEAYRRARIGDAVRAKIDAMLEPNALAAALLAFAGIFVASQFTPVGWAADITFFFTAVFVGSAVIAAGEHLIQFVRIAGAATTDDQLTAAGREFAAALAEIEVDALLFFVGKVIGGAGGEPPSNIPPSANAVLATRNGQLVLVTAETIPAQVATQWGVLGAGATSMAMTAGSGTGGKDKPAGEAGGRKLPAPPRDRTFQRGGLKFGFKGSEEAWDFLENMPPGNAVYEVQDASGQVIYVGITERGWVRWGEHLAQKGGEWLGRASRFKFVAQGLVEKDALALEYDLIKANPQCSNQQLTYQVRFGEPPGAADIPKTNTSVYVDLEHR